VGSKDNIDIGSPLHDGGFVFLGKTSAHRDLHARAFALDGGKVAESSIQSVVGVLSNRAGVDHHDIGDLVTLGFQVSQQTPEIPTSALNRGRSFDTQRCAPRRCDHGRDSAPERRAPLTLSLHFHPSGSQQSL
jgi:hypothetical protein